MTTSNLNEPGVPNKPLVLTATDFTEEHSRNLGRQHTGRPLGSQQRAAKRRAAGSERRPEEHELGQRATFNEQRSGERRVASGEWRATATSIEVASDELRATRRRATCSRAAWWRVAGDGRRAAWRNMAVHSGVPNKPMVLAATGALWIARPAVAAAHRRAVRRRAAGSERRTTCIGW